MTMTAEQITTIQALADVVANGTDLEKETALLALRAISEAANETKPSFEWNADRLSYHRNRQGRWVVIGPVEMLRLGVVDVMTKAGKTKQELITRLGEPFDHAGRQFRYGYMGR